MKLWQRSQRYDARRGRFAAWLLSVTRFAAIDRLRQEGRHPRLVESPDREPDDMGWLEQLLPSDHASRSAANICGCCWSNFRRSSGRWSILRFLAG